MSQIALPPPVAPSTGINRLFVVSFVIHTLIAGGLYLYLYAWPAEEHYVATVALYMGDAENDRETTGKGKGNKDASKDDKKTSSDTGTGPSTSSNADWGTASDPSTEGGSRYAPDLWIDGNLEDFYPARAKQANLGKVTVRVSLYIDSTGKIREVRVQGVRSAGNAHAPYEADFRQAAQQIALTRMRLRSAGYRKDGRPVDFIWDTVINFTLQ